MTQRFRPRRRLAERQWRRALDPLERIARGLTPAQRRAVFDEVKPLRIIAGAGTGKTRVLTRRIARRILDGSTDSEATLAITFTRRAAAELSDRLRALDVDTATMCGTIHSIAYGQLKELWSMHEIKPRSVLANPRPLLRDVCTQLGMRSDWTTIRTVANELTHRRARLTNASSGNGTTPDEAGRATTIGSRIDEVDRAYRLAKHRAGVIDFDDMIDDLTIAISADQHFAKLIRRRSVHTYIDEFQDLTSAQFRLVQAWIGNDPTPDICVVGDHAQAIYGFGGADARHLAEFSTMWPTTQTVELPDNFRSSAKILEIADAVLGDAALSKRATPRFDTLATGARAIVSHPDETSEMSWVARTAIACHGPNRPWSSMAVLVRTNSLIEPIREAFESAGVPAIADGPVIDRCLADDILDVMLTLDPGAPISAAVDRACDSRHLPVVGIDARRGSHTVSTIQRLAQDFAKSGNDDRVAFVDHVRATLEHEIAARSSGFVRLLTMHRAKGLEFDTVFICGLEDGLMPIANSGARSSIEDERRLLHVAVTRAKRHLYLSWCRSRSGRMRRPSRFLENASRIIEIDARDSTPTVDGPRWMKISRDQLESDKSTTSDLYDTIVAWRNDHSAGPRPSRGALSNASIRSIVSKRPTTTAQLASVCPNRELIVRYGKVLLEIVHE